MRAPRPQGATVAAVKTNAWGITSAFLAIVIFLSSVAFSAVALNTKEAHGFEWVKWGMCKVLPDPAKELYQYANTDDLPYMLRSKSAGTGGSEDVDYYLNKLITVGYDKDFVDNNDQILGYSVRTDANPAKEKEGEKTDEQKEAEDKMNEAASKIQEEMRLNGAEFTSAVNGGMPGTPYDRFGVAGLIWTNYVGEWKYLIVDACADHSEPKDPKTGEFYVGRLAPRDTWDNRANSKDPRVLQSTRPLGAHILMASMTLVANALFAVTKLLVAVTLALIGMAFGDVQDTMGINNILAADNGGGIFNSLFSGFFSPLIIIAFLIVGLRMGWMGMVKREYRKSMGELYMGLAYMTVAFIIAAVPQQAVALPNQVANIGQALIVSSIGGSITSSEGVCSKEGGEKEIVSAAAATEDESVLEEANKNIRDSVGCLFWESFLLRPWSQGQFGVYYDKLWANGHIPGHSRDDKELGNKNEKYVGEASVPLGGGTTINNWAILQISTMTNAHAMIRGDSKKPTTHSNGVAVDWWRIADALSNYDEETVVQRVFNNGQVSEHVKSTQQKMDNPRSEYWNQWVGNSSANRMGVAVFAFLAAGIGLIVPLLLGMLSVAYTIGLSLLMGFAPFFLLMAVWGGQGREWFKSWASLLLNTLVKKIVIAFILMVTLIGETTVLGMMNEIGYGSTILLLILVAMIMWKSRDKIMSTVATFNFGSGAGQFAQTASGVVNQGKEKIARPLILDPARVAVSAVGGGIGAKRGGGTWVDGISDGVKYEVRNIAWRHNASREALTEYDIVSGKPNIEGEYCAACGTPLEFDSETKAFRGGIVTAGRYVCERCYNERIIPEATPFSLRQNGRATGNIKRQGWADKRRKAKTGQLNMLHARHEKAFGKSSLYTKLSGNADEILSRIATGEFSGRGETGEQNEVNAAVSELAVGMNFALSDHFDRMQAKKFDQSVSLPDVRIPDIIQKFGVNKEAMETALREGNYEYFASMYAQGIANIVESSSAAKDGGKVSVDELVEDMLPSKYKEARETGGV